MKLKIIQNLHSVHLILSTAVYKSFYNKYKIKYENSSVLNVQIIRIIYSYIYKYIHNFINTIGVHVIRKSIKFLHYL